MKPNEELKPCPFCGGQALISARLPYFGEPYTIAVVCENCNASSNHKKTMKEAIEAWNRRQTMERDEIVKALEQCTTNKHWCGDCPYIPEDSCRGHLLEDALALIRELTEENEAQDKAIINALKQIAKVREVTKADTVRKFVEMLKDKTRLLTSHDDDMVLAVDIEDIEKIAQELLGGEQK